MKKKKSIFIMAICLAVIAVISLVYVLNRNQSSKFGIRQNEIKTIEMYNNLYEKKVITNYYDKKKLINIIESVSIVKSDMEPPIGIGDTVIINYNDGTKNGFHFLGSSMNTFGKSKEVCYEIGENILPELEKIYNRHQMTAIEKIIFLIFIAGGFICIVLGMLHKNKQSKVTNNEINDYKKYVMYNTILPFAEGTIFIILGGTELIFSYDFYIALMIIILALLLYTIMNGIINKKFKRC